MESLLSKLAQHGYPILFALVFLETVGLPIPAAVALLIAGGASARGSIYFPLAAAGSLAVMMTGDTLMFLMGRYTGWWLLGLLCRLSLNPESCILRAADSFYRRGRVALVFAKFLPGINTMAPPLAGSMNMRIGQFLALDLAGASLYIGVYLSAGFLFSDAIGTLTNGYQMAGRVVSWVLIAAAIGYLGTQLWMWKKARELSPIPLVEAAEIARALAADEALVYDVRSHGYYQLDATRIPGSKRLEPNAIQQFQPDLSELFMTSNQAPHSGKKIYLYCTCLREATSVRVARVLLDKGLSSSVLRGGLRAWKKAGLPLEPVPPEEIEALPVFESRNAA